MKQSFVRKLMFGSMLILIITFGAQWLLQQQLIPQVLLSRTQNQIEAELNPLPTSLGSSEVDLTIDRLATTTGAFTTLININDVRQETLQLATYTIDSNGVLYDILRPRMPMGNARIGSLISGTFYASSVVDVYIPLTVTIGSRPMFGNQLTASFSEELFLQLGVDTTRTIPLSGVLVSTNEVLIQDSQQSLSNSELVNLMAQTNITALIETDRWIQYQSLDEFNNPLNLVYVTPVTINQTSYLLLTIYPLSAGRTIARVLSVVSIISLAVALFITGGVYVWFFQRIAVPLQRVNEATKRFAVLDFSPIPVLASNDEIEDLSTNINLLSATLSTTLRELEERNQVLLSQLEQEQVIETRRQELMSGISHELKTPLAIIQASIEAMNHGVFSAEDLPSIQATIEQEIERATQILMNLIQIHQGDATLLAQQRVTFDIAPMIQQIIDHYQPLLTQRGLTVVSSIEPTMIHAAPEKMELVLSNLVSNAIKYATSSSSIQITYSNHQFVICNATDLPSTTDTASLFAPFYRVDKGRSRQDGSTGLGLTIVKQILDQHEFNIRLTLQENQFCIMFETK
jgi:signal transduction histidine kinase